jgi:hypothetical protein
MKDELFQIYSHNVAVIFQYPRVDHQKSALFSTPNDLAQGSIVLWISFYYYYLQLADD